MKVISYNIHKGMDKNKKDTLDQIIKYVKSQDCDIVCLQEVLYPQYKHIKSKLNMNGIFAENIKEKQYGICIFSKYKIDASNHVLLTSVKEQRGFAHIKVKINESDYFNVINVHLGLDKDERVKQIDEILNFVNKKLDGNSKNLAGNMICGDFNGKNISIKNFEDVAVKLKKHDIPTFSTSRIDYCLANTKLKLKSYEVEKVEMSDHYPIIIKFA
ncbi:endonuclease/exonuclease/phosphatase family protein [Intestinibacter sp.]